MAAVPNDDAALSRGRVDTMIPCWIAYRWRKLYGGMGRSQLKRMKQLEKENQRLRRAVSDLTLGKLILTEAAKGNF